MLKFYYYVTKDPTERPSADEIRAGGKFKMGPLIDLVAQQIGGEVMGFHPENSMIVVWMVEEDAGIASCLNVYKSFEVSIEADLLEPRDLDGSPL